MGNSSVTEVPPIARIRERLRAARVGQQLSRERAAEMAGVSPKTWRYYETGMTRIGENFGDVCRAVGLDPMAVLEEEGYL